MGGPQAAPRVVVDDIEEPSLEAQSAHHLSHVLRMRAGAALEAVDGEGGLRRCVLSGPRARPVLEAIEEATFSPRPSPSLCVAFSLVKGDRPSWTVQKLTELGIDKIVLLAASNSVVRWDTPEVDRQLERLTRVAKGALEQSRGLWLPALEGPMGLSELQGDGVVMADMGGRPLDGSETAIAVGPEGGWDDQERALDLDVVSLGSTVLRSETAAVAAGVLLRTFRDGLAFSATPRGGQCLP